MKTSRAIIIEFQKSRWNPITVSKSRWKLYEEISKKLSTQAAFGNPFICVLIDFRNLFFDSLVAFLIFLTNRKWA